MNMLTNWLNNIGQIISDGKISYPCFFGRKGRRIMWEKNKAVTPRLAFPFFLKTVVNQGRFQKKKNITSAILE